MGVASHYWRRDVEGLQHAGADQIGRILKSRHIDDLLFTGIKDEYLKETETSTDSDQV